MPDGGAHRGFTAAELDSHPWLQGPGSWRAVRRFAVFQKDKWRPIDDASESGMNAVTGSRDRLSLVSADMPARMARAYFAAHAARGEPMPAFEFGTDDIKKAFRRLHNAAYALYVILLWDPTRSVPAYFLLPGFIFGCYSAVIAWNRYPALVCHVARRLLAVPTVFYFDDGGTGGAAYERGSGATSLWALLSLIGLGLEPAKHVPMDQVAKFLGVLSDFSRAPVELGARLGVTADRRDKLVSWIHAIRARGVITSSEASSLFGKSRYVFCPIFGRLGIACLQPLQDVQRTCSFAAGSELDRCLTFLSSAVQVVRPTFFPFCPAVRQLRCVVLTDASFSDMSGCLGVVVWCPRLERWFYASARVPPWMLALFQRLVRKKNYICHFELLAAVCAYLTFPDILASRLVHHLLDNEAALRGLIKGYSGKPDSGRIIHEYSVQVLRLACRPWLGFVYSEDNLSDLPSRGEYRLLRRIGATRRLLRLPKLSAWLQSDATFSTGFS